MPIQFVFRDVHDANLEHRVSLRLENKVIEPTPCALDLLKLRRMHDLVQLGRELFVQLRDHFLERVEDVRFNEAGIGERLLNQSVDGVFNLRRRPLGSRLEALLQ